MAEFTIKIAGASVAVRSLFESTRDYCAAYLTEEVPEILVGVTQADLIQEQAELDAEACREGLRRRAFSEPFLERAAIQRKVAAALFERDVLLLHGSTVAVEGKAYLFTAQCGTGKSTHTRLWREAFGSRAVMVNDDKPFLRLTETEVLACGAPWSGKHGLDTNITVPLQGICILRRGTENRIAPISPGAALPMLEAQCGPPEAPSRQLRYRDLLRRLTERVPLWQMECTKAPEAALTAHRAMSQPYK